MCISIQHNAHRVVRLKKGMFVRERVSERL